MPYIQLQVGGPLTQKQKKKIAEEFSATLERVAQKPKSHTYIVIEEVPRENWAVGDKFLNEK